VKSTGAGTFDQPELVVEATLERSDAARPRAAGRLAAAVALLAIRNGRLIVRGSSRTSCDRRRRLVGESMAIDGNVRVTITDIARAIALSPATASLPASGNLVLDLKLGGKLTPIEALVVDATAPVFNLRSRSAVHASRAAAAVAAQRRITFDSFSLQQRRRASGRRLRRSRRRQARRHRPARRRRGGAAAASSRATSAPTDKPTSRWRSRRITESALTGSIELVDAQVKFAGFPQLIDEINGAALPSATASRSSRCGRRSAAARSSPAARSRSQG
jgi:hypothetical protein